MLSKLAAMIDWLRKTSLTEQALLIAFGVSLALLAGAHFFERVVGLVPCALCLDQREAHWAALSVAAAGILVAKLFNARLGAAAAVGAAALVYAVSTGLAFFHTGVEYGFWPGPASCSGTGETISDLSAIAASLNTKSEGPSCDDAAWTFFGISMAGYNMLISAGLFALTLIAAIAETRRARNGRLGAAQANTPSATS